MVVDNFHALRARAVDWPFKADAPAIVDPDGVLPFPVSSQRFEAVRVQRGEITQASRSVENPQALLSLATERSPFGDTRPVGEPLRSPVPIALDHYVGATTFYV